MNNDHQMVTQNQAKLQLRLNLCNCDTDLGKVAVLLGCVWSFGGRHSLNA